MKRLLLCLMLVCGSTLATADVSLTAAQQAELSRVAPGVNLTPELISQLRALV